MNDFICIFTGHPKKLESSLSDNYIFYEVTLLGKSYTLYFCKKCLYQSELRKKAHILRSILLNEMLPDLQTKIIHWGCNDKDGIDLKEELSHMSYPKTPKDKLDNLIRYLYKMQDFDGELVDISNKLEHIWNYNYFKNSDECKLYFETMEKSNFLTLYNPQDEIITFRFTYEGLNYLVKISDESFISKKCFIAMAFDDETKRVREAIKQAILDTGFDPIIIDEKHLSSDNTINDAIISNLRSSKFCIADFTLHRNGVYFESGFALGLGKPVIYLCRKDEFEKAHFDIKPLQHIIYETEDELTKKLIDKIKAWII